MSNSIRQGDTWRDCFKGNGTMSGWWLFISAFNFCCFFPLQKSVVGLLFINHLFPMKHCRNNCIMFVAIKVRLSCDNSRHSIILFNFKTSLSCDGISLMSRIVRFSIRNVWYSSSSDSDQFQSFWTTLDFSFWLLFKYRCILPARARTDRNQDGFYVLVKLHSWPFL